MKKTETIKIKGSWASYKNLEDKGLYKCDVDELAEKIIKGGWGNMPKSLSDAKAMEIVLLAKAYLKYRDQDNGKFPRKELLKSRYRGLK